MIDLILLDTNYVSPLLTEVLSKSHKTIYDVTHQRFLRTPLSFQSFDDNDSILMNAEIGIETLNEFLPTHRLTTLANLFKNKVAFRKLLASKYPNFFYKSYDFEQLKIADIENLPYPIVLKPVFGYGSEGVCKCNDANKVRAYMKEFECNNGAGDMQLLIEQYIDGQEYAIDCYYDEIGDPVILNIFTRNFKDSEDVGDRIYYTSKEVMSSTLNKFYTYLKSFGENFRLMNVPLHMELRITLKDEIVPIEINPLRFAGEGTTELGYYAYQINPYEYYINKRKPDWEQIISNMDDAIYSFTCAEIDRDIKYSQVERIHHAALKKQFKEILDYRVLPIETRTTFAVIFFKSSSIEEHKHILDLDFMQFVALKNINQPKGNIRSEKVEVYSS
ncbi:MAG: ATP-grasp domain-containing protein [Lysinibacillus sp.]